MHKKWGMVLLVVVACGDDDMPTPDAAMMGDPVCERHADCDDTEYCNGTELCQPDDANADPFGCLVGEAPCGEDQLCDEEANRCIVDCGFAPDGDGDGRNAIGCGGDDCDDTDPNRFPGNIEVCDAEGHDEDCDSRTVGERDRDGDGAIDAMCCNADPEGGPTRCGEDCNDSRRDVRPGLPEVCDALDNDCDGSSDEGLLIEGYEDHDRDLHGDPNLPTSSCPGLPGFSTVGDDCDDDNPSRHGSQVEVCDGIDNDCDSLQDESPASTTWYRDADDDGFGSAGAGITVACIPPAGHVLRLGDCDDEDRGANPLGMERCNGADDDCNGRADYQIAPGDQEDDDGDGFADATCGGDDCDDANPDVHEGAVEVMDELDNDCDGTIDEAPDTVPWYIDRDGDGYGIDSEPSIEAVEQPAGRAARAGDCNDSDASIHPGVPDGCDGLDADCDGILDETAPRIAYYADADGDGWGSGEASDSVLACRPPPGTSDRPLDCDDSDNEVFPGAPEQCNMTDSDCDGEVDEAPDRPWYPDADGDGHGSPDNAIMGCVPLDGYVAAGDDCDDMSSAISPSATESCNGINDDCDESIDEMTDAQCADLPGGTGTCVAGQCELVCDDGRGDCNSNPSDGCETDTSNNRTHCGACFQACSAGDTCGFNGDGCDEAPIVQIVSGNGHTIIRRVGGGVAGWGDGTTHGAHGIGGVVDQLTPGLTVAPALVHVDSGWDHVLGVTTDGRAFGWGNNGNGQLGDGTRSSRPGGVYVDGLTDVMHVAAGGNHSCAVVREEEMGEMFGRVYCWGLSNHGQVGPNGNGSFVLAPAIVPGIDDATQVYCGNDMTCVLRSNPIDGTYVSCFGRGNGGELGDGNRVSSSAPVNVISLPPDVIELVPGSGSRACVRTAALRVYCWGQRPGDGSTSASSPVVVANVDDALAASQGPTSHPDRFAREWGLACVISEAGGAKEIWCWGSNDANSLGGAYTSGTTEPVPLLDTDGNPVSGAVAITGGYHHGCAVIETETSYEVLCWGENTSGELGRGTVSANETPGVVMGLP